VILGHHVQELIYETQTGIKFDVAGEDEVGVGRQSGYIPADIYGIGEVGHRLVAFVAGDLGVGQLPSICNMLGINEGICLVRIPRFLCLVVSRFP